MSFTPAITVGADSLPATVGWAWHPGATVCIPLTELLGAPLA